MKGRSMFNKEPKKSKGTGGKVVIVPKQITLTSGFLANTGERTVSLIFEDVCSDRVVEVGLQEKQYLALMPKLEELRAHIKK